MFFNYFYYFIENANEHNFADDNTLTTFAQNVRNLISVLKLTINKIVESSNIWETQFQSKLCQYLQIRSKSVKNPLISLKKVLVKSKNSNYFYLNFSYYPLVWMFSSAKSKSLQKSRLCYLHSNYESPYDTLIGKSDQVNLKASRLRTLCVKKHKSISSINPFFMNKTSTLKVTTRDVRSQYKRNLDIPKVN